MYLAYLIEYLTVHAGWFRIQIVIARPANFCIQINKWWNQWYADANDHDVRIKTIYLYAKLREGVCQVSRTYTRAMKQTTRKRARDGNETVTVDAFLYLYPWDKKTKRAFSVSSFSTKIQQRACQSGRAPFTRYSSRPTRRVSGN